MNIAIFTCNTGEGHNSAAKAIAQELSSRGITYEIKNALTFTPKSKQKMIENGHAFMYKHSPGLYARAYMHTEKQDHHSLMYYDYSKYSFRIAKYLKQNNVDAAICVHEFPAFMLTSARKMQRLDIPLYYVSTDYAFTPGVEETEMNKYFVPWEMTDLFAAHGIPKDAIVETGIPINRYFYCPHDKSSIRKELGLREDIPVILISAGSIGCGPIQDLALHLHEECRGQCTIVILCGNNKSLLRKLTAQEDDYLFPVGFTDKAKQYMAAADVMIAKPGGLTTTEAATCGLPVVLLDAVPGLETHNLDYFVEHECAIAPGSLEGFSAVVEKLSRDAERLQSISQKQRELFQRKNAAETIVDSVLEDTEKRRKICSDRTTLGEKMKLWISGHLFCAKRK